MGMIDSFLNGEDWDDPPEAMAFEASYGIILEETTAIVAMLSEIGRAHV